MYLIVAPASLMISLLMPKLSKTGSQPQKHQIKKDFPRTHLLGNRIDRKTFKKRIIELDTIDYLQGMFFGAIIVTTVSNAFFSQTDLPQHPGKKETQFVFIDRTGDPAGFSTIFFESDPDIWSIGFVHYPKTAKKFGDAKITCIFSEKAFAMILEENPQLKPDFFLKLQDNTILLNTLFHSLLHVTNSEELLAMEPCVIVNKFRESQTSNLPTRLPKLGINLSRKLVDESLAPKISAFIEITSFAFQDHPDNQLTTIINLLAYLADVQTKSSSLKNNPLHQRLAKYCNAVRLERGGFGWLGRYGNTHIWQWTVQMLKQLLLMHLDELKKTQQLTTLLRDAKLPIKALQKGITLHPFRDPFYTDPITLQLNNLITKALSKKSSNDKTEMELKNEGATDLRQYRL
jgi:hypothetical protein